LRGQHRAQSAAHHLRFEERAPAARSDLVRVRVRVGVGVGVRVRVRDP